MRLTVTDKDGESDTAELHFLRLPASFFPFGKDQPERSGLVARIQAAVVRAGKREAPTKIEVDGHADNVGSAAENLRVEVFILGQDTQVIAPRGCHAGRSVLSDW